MSTKNIYFTGSLPRDGEVPVGGGEVGNFRTVRMLELFGYKVHVVKRLRSKAKKSRFFLILEYPFRVFFILTKWLFILLFAKRKNALVHISGFYGSTILLETIQVFIAHSLGYYIIYELRGGGATDFYNEGSKLYRKQFRYIINTANYLFSQGRENEPLLQKLSKTPIFYYPNCVQYGFYPVELSAKPTNNINLLYFGRIEPQKNPLLIVKIASLLQKSYNNVYLTMIGDGQKELIEKVTVLADKLLLSGSFQFIAGCKHEDLQEHLINKHFFIFPSVQPREGQSNAITEAMSFGIIPIVSPQGFNRSTVGDDFLVVKELSAEAYADRITIIIDNAEINKYSLFVRNRFHTYFSEKVVFERTKLEYEKIFYICN